MRDYSILIGGAAGDGIDSAGLIIARILNRIGLYTYIYRDYPSLIRGGHTFSIIRASDKKIKAHKNKVDFILALNQDTVNLHRNKLKKDCLFIYDSDQVKLTQTATCGTGLSLANILKEEAAPAVMRNSCVIGAFCKATGIKWDILDEVFRKDISREIDLNLKVARKGFDSAEELIKIEPFQNKTLPILTGNEIIGMGLIKGGLKAYVAYPMTPVSGVLHFLAGAAEKFSLKVLHPESEIAVILMALGFSYMGEKVAVGTSGGGFCLMTEGLSLSGMAELPVVVVLGQRPGPSTGLPTYTSQTDLHFAINAGQGEFLRFTVAPGDAEEAYYWSATVLNLTSKYRAPGIILTDKTLSEGTYNFDVDSVDKITDYSAGQTFPPVKDKVIKVNSYEHDETGITTEDPKVAVQMQDKRLQKEKALGEELKNYKCVGVYGDKKASTILLCWGSNKGVCVEVGEKLGLRVVHPVVLSPFPVEQFKEAIKGAKKIIAVENNATGQLISLIKRYDFNVDEKILRYDGRPFAVEELEEAVKKLL